MSDTPKHDDMEVRHAAAAGLDVHKMQVTATVRTHAGREAPVVETREFSALASGLFLASRWLKKLKQYGYFDPLEREEQTDMPTRTA